VPKTGQERGALPYALMEPRHVEEMRDEKLELPGAANNRVKALRRLFKWAKAAKKPGARNPAAEVEYIRRRGDGFPTWTTADVAKFEEAHPVGTQARLCLALLLYTGVRRSDVVKLGPQHERTGWLHFTETKGSRKVGATPKVRDIPIIPPLREVLDASKEIIGPFAYLVTERGVPFTVNGFGNKFQDWVKAAGLPVGLAAHGLRKAAAVNAVENGATDRQLMALFGWETEKEASRYTKRANRKKLAGQAAPLLDFNR
jgi:integrase